MTSGVTKHSQAIKPTPSDELPAVKYHLLKVPQCHCKISVTGREPAVQTQKLRGTSYIKLQYLDRLRIFKPREASLL